MKIIDYKDLTPELARTGCFVLNMPNSDYHAYQGISKSGLDLVARSPAHFLMQTERAPSRTLQLGTALHTAVLEPERFKAEYCLLTEVTDRRSSEYKQAVKIHTSDNVLVAKEAANILSIQETIRGQDEINELLTSCDLFELSAFIEIDGVLCRCRYDAFDSKNLVAVDLKTTQNSSPTEFSKSVFNYRYHVQDAFYSKIFKLITGRTLNAFKFLAVENDPPHCPMIYTLSDETRMIADSLMIADLKAYKEAESSSKWSGYEQTNEPLDLPSWAVAQYENNLDEGIV